MADSCRPVSRHGRYNATGPSSMPYTSQTSPYGNGDFGTAEEIYTVNEPVMDIPERPHTSRGKQSRNRADIPPRPESRRSRKQRGPVNPDAEGYGRPASRVGFSPDSSYRYSHDEYSRQVLSDSPVEEGGRYILHNSPDSPANVYGRTPPQRDLYRQSPQQQTFDNYGETSYGIDRVSFSPNQREGYRESPQYQKPSPRDYMNVSPIQRDEPQIQADDLHHATYSEHFQESPPFRESPYRNSPARDQHAGAGSPEAHYRPPTGQRPKSARPKTGRKKSARYRQKHQEEYQTQQQQQQQQMQQPFDATTFLTAGDPYGRPSSSLSRYKPLPAIGASTPRGSQPDTLNAYGESVGDKMEKLSAETQHLVLDERLQPVAGEESVSAEDLHGADLQGSSYSENVPSVDILTNFRQHLSDTIYKKSMENFERMENMDAEEEENKFEHSYDNSKSKTFHIPHDLPSEPSESDKRLLLAIRLPGGERHQRYFRPSDTLENVLHFAENIGSADFSEYHLACNAPKTIFMDLLQQIGETDLKDRTVLYLEEKEKN